MITNTMFLKLDFGKYSLKSSIYVLLAVLLLYRDESHDIQTMT